jgi:hypothetical protein
MRVAPGALPPPSPVHPTKAPAPPVRPPASEVAPRRTSTNVAEIRGALERAHSRLFGHAATPQLLDVLTAHVGLETADGREMFNHNFGGIKGRGPSGKMAVCRTHEYGPEGKVTIRDGFRAYDSLEQGAGDYLRLMRERFGTSLEPARRGDVDAFAAALKRKHYYTAPERLYADGLRARIQAHGGSVSAPGGASRGGPSLDDSPLTLEEASLQRLIDALRAAELAEASVRGGAAPRRREDVDLDDDV